MCTAIHSTSLPPVDYNTCVCSPGGNFWCSLKWHQKKKVLCGWIAPKTPSHDKLAVKTNTSFSCERCFAGYPSTQLFLFLMLLERASKVTPRGPQPHVIVHWGWWCAMYCHTILTLFMSLSLNKKSTLYFRDFLYL